MSQITITLASVILHPADSAVHTAEMRSGEEIENLICGNMRTMIESLSCKSGACAFSNDQLSNSFEVMREATA